MSVITRPGDLVALVPSIIGFQPRESVVVVLLGRKGVMANLVRLDRSDLDSPAGHEAAFKVAAHAARTGINQALVFSFTENPQPCQALRRMVSALQDTVGQVVGWMVHDGRMFDPDCPDPECCPPGGTVVPEPDPEATIGLWRAAPLLDTAATPEDRRNGARSAQRWVRRSVDPARWRVESVDLWRAAYDTGATTPAHLGKLMGALTDVVVRDAILITLIPGADQAVSDICQGVNSPAVEEAFGRGMRPTVPPDLARTKAAVDLLKAVFDLARPTRRAPAATMMGVISWWTNERGAALDWCDVALTADPAYRLAHLLRALIDREGWDVEERTMWRPAPTP